MLYVIIAVVVIIHFLLVLERRQEAEETNRIVKRIDTVLRFTLEDKLSPFQKEILDEMDSK